jgi:3-methylcrotonyl-CoA carboxylase alpha subunit
MSGLTGRVGALKLTWLSVPKGPSGTAYVRCDDGEQIEVSWRRDADGIWIELADGLHGFDLQGRADDDGSRAFSISRRGGDERCEGARFLRGADDLSATAGAGRKKGLRVRAQMPGKIVRVMVKAGASVEKDQPLVVMEAMKMENEIRAPGPGKVGAVKVTEGQAVETGADLLVLE